jgi:hypothetical protein
MRDWMLDELWMFDELSEAEAKSPKYSHRQKYDNRKARSHTTLKGENSFSTRDAADSGLAMREKVSFGDER